MPAIKLYGRRWHFGTDVIPLPAALAFTFHFSWVIILLVGALASGEWPSHCESWQGVQYIILFAAYFGSFAVASVNDALLFYHGVKGAPFEEKKRKYVVPLLYLGTVPLLIQAAATFYGTWVCVDLEPDCWEKGGNTRNAVTNFAQALVFINWGFCFLAGLGIAIFYNMYPEVHQEETWEQRCACIATLLCCRQQIEKPVREGRRPPLKNIAELASGILSHIDVDATDLAAAVILTSAAQQRRRRLRIAKALLPVYETLRQGQRERSVGGGQQQYTVGGGEDGIEAQERGEHFSSAFDPGSLFEEREQMELEEEDSDATVPDDSEVEEDEEEESRRGRKGKRGRRRQRGGRGGRRFKFLNKNDIDDSVWVPSNPSLTRALTFATQVSQQQQGSQMLQGADQTLPSPSPPAATRSLDLSTDNVAALNTVQKLEELKDVKGNNIEGGKQQGEPGYELELRNPNNSASDINSIHNGVPHNKTVLDISPPTDENVEGMSQAAAELAAEEIASRDAPPAQTIDQLASAIQEEVEELGEGPIEDSLLTIKQQDSLDLTSIRMDPKNPLIWVHPSPSESEAESEGENEKSKFSGIRRVSVEILGAGEEDLQGGKHGEIHKIEKGMKHAASAVNHAVEKLSKQSGRSSPSVDAEVAAAALAQIAEQANAGNDTTGADSETAIIDAVINNEENSNPENSSTRPPSSSSRHRGDQGQEEQQEQEYPKLPIERQITLQHPTVITPSAHVENFTGPLSPEALAEIYAGRHEIVPAEKLKFASSFIRYAYAAYALHSKMENPNHLLNCLCFSPPDPAAVVFKSLSALGEMVGDEDVEILHLNCSNRVLSHLPYLIALDHAERAVVISIRGTIGIADLVTDAVVHPDNIDDWLPDEVAEKLDGAPALAHAGMVAAARAVFEDMTERGILRELVEGEEEAIVDLTRGSRGNENKIKNENKNAAGNEPGRGSSSSSSPASSSAAAAGAGQGDVPKQQSLPRKGQHAPDNPHYRHFEEYEQYKKEAQEGDGGDDEATGAGRAVGDLMRKKVQEEGWQLVVVGHSLGAGAGALISLKLRHYYPQLKCLAFSCPGGLVNKKLSHAMTSFCTTIAVGKDCIPRSSVATVTRLMDELVTSLARCKQPKMRVLFAPWWKRHRQRFKDLFYDYNEIPGEAAAALMKYYESRRKLGQPIEMYPPGKVIFLRPIKARKNQREWDAIYIAPEDLIGEGILVSPNMLKDHLCSVAYEALNEAREKAEAAEERKKVGAGDEVGMLGGVLRGAGKAVRAPWSAVQGVAQVWGGQPARARQGSPHQALINAV